MLLDAKLTDDDGWSESRLFDVCICGAGPAGITLARSLANHGRTVALLEGGGLEFSAESQELYRGDAIGLPYAPLDQCRLRFLGGSSNHWGGYTRPLDGRDFEPLAQNPLNAWPITKRDLEPYADWAAAILDLPPPEPAFDIFGGKENLIAPSQYRVSPMQFAPKYLDDLARSERISLCLNANLVDIELEPGLGAVSAFVLRSYSRAEPFRIRARNFVVCCGGLENARILLNADRQIAGGIGNRYDQVGRYFSEHLEIPVGAAVLVSPPSTLNFYMASDQLIAARQCLSFELELLPLARDAAACTLPFAKRLARVLREPAEPCFDATLLVVIGQYTNRNSRITLSDAKDRFGLRSAVLDWRLTDIDHQTVKVAALEMGLAMARHDVGRLRLDTWVTQSEGKVPLSNEAGGSSHHMCTTRMSNEPSTGVVDRDCRVHGVDNLFVGGSSVFASAGVSNPTLTIVQLALRLGDHVHDRLVRTE